MNFTRKFGLIIVVLAAVFLLYACDGSQPFKDLRVYIDNLKHANVQPDTKEKVITTEEMAPASVKYESETRRSPFEVMGSAPAKGIDSSNPLQAYPIDMLRFVGTVTQNGKTTAFVSAPDNKIYQVKEGDILGDNEEKVISIESDRISLMEQESEIGSNGMKHMVTMQLREVSQ